MRRTWAYNGIFIGLILGITLAVVTDSWVVGIIAAIVGSVGCFLGIRALENLLHKGVVKAEDAIKNKIDSSNKNSSAGDTVAAGSRLCPYCGEEIPAVSSTCPFCSKSLESVPSVAATVSSVASDEEPPIEIKSAPVSEAPVQLNSYAKPPKPKKNGKATASRFFGKFFAVMGALANIFALLVLPEYLEPSYVGWFEDLLYYVAEGMMVFTLVGCAFVVFNPRRGSLKGSFIAPLVMMFLAGYGAFYSFAYEYYYHTTFNMVLAIVGGSLVVLSALLLVIAVFTKKNALNFIALIVNLMGTLAIYFFYGYCMINNYYYAEIYFLLGCLDLTGLAVVMLLMQGAYNSDKKFDAPAKPETMEVTENE